MLRHTVVAVIGAVLVSGCAHAPLQEAERSPSAVRWVEGPTPDVRTLLLRPIHIGAVEGAGHAPAELDVGAFFARFDSEGGPVDQLALMIEVHGADAAELLRSSRQLLLEVDGELFVGEPGVSANSFRVDQVEDRPRATVVIPVGPEVLAQLAEADVVRGRLGLWASFTVPPSCRERFRELLAALPEGASSTVLDRTALRRVTDLD
jgi:hypothetical protein